MFVQRHFIKTKRSQIGAVILSRKEYNIIRKNRKEVNDNEKNRL